MKKETNNYGKEYFSKGFFKLLLNNKVLNNWDDFFGIVISIVPEI